MSRKGKLPALKASNLVLRSITTQGSGLAVIATETPIERWDEQRQMVVKEVLLMDGCIFRGGRDHVPIVDSHDDSTVRNVLGSIQRMQIKGGELFGMPSWASTEDAQETATKVSEGHLTDFSITAKPIESIFVSRGQAYDWARGSVEGPAIVHVKWEPHNASICTTGADVNSVVRRSYTDLERKVTRMDEALLSQLSAMGLPEGMTDPNQVLAWVVGKLTPMAEPGDVVENMEAPKPADETPPAPPVENTMKPEEVARQAEAAVKRALEADKVRRKEIQAACTLAKVERAFADELCDSGVTVEVANKRIIERMANQPTGTSANPDVRVTGSGWDRQFAAMRDGLITRSLASTTLKNRKLEKPAEGHQDFVNLPVRRMAAMIVREELGLSYQHIERMSELEIMRLAMGHPQALRRNRGIIMRDAYHTTGSFGNLLLDAINKTLLTAYEEAQYSYTIWARQGASTQDLKAIHRMRFSEFPNLEMIAETKRYPEKIMTDSKESYRPDKYGAMLTFSWEAFISDDLDAFSKSPVMMGNAAKRTINQKVYEVLTANDVMGDGVALFGAHASGSNTSGAAAAPSVTTLNAGFAAMRRQKGLNSNVAINVTPRYLIHSPQYEATVDELLISTSYNAANNNEGVKNLYGPDGPKKRRLVPVCDNALGDTNTDWFLAADQAQGVDTVEYTFLQGEETPVIDQEEDFDTDTYKFKIRQTFGVKAIDWRGLYRNKA